VGTVFAFQKLKEVNGYSGQILTIILKLLPTLLISFHSPFPKKAEGYF